MPRFTWFCCVALLLQTPLQKIAWGALSPEEYEKALQIAQKKVVRDATLAQPGALTAAPASRIVGRYYETGEYWDVAVWRIQPTLMRRTSEPEYLKASESAPQIFRYEVIEAKTGANAKVLLHATQVSGKPVDPNTEYLEIELNQQLVQAQKGYKLKKQNSVIAVSEGIRSQMTPLDLLPLDFPNLLTAERQKPESLPELPEAIRKTALEMGYAPDLSKSVWFEQDDFFGRPVQALWQNGDPWPIFLRTAYGIAILVRKESRL